MSEPQPTPTATDDPAVSAIAPDGHVVVAPVEAAASPPPAPLDLTLLSEGANDDEAATTTDEAVVVDVSTALEPVEPLLVDPIVVTVNEVTPDASDDDADMVIAEAATPSFVSFETLESPSAAPEPLQVAASAAGDLPPVAEAASEKEITKVTTSEEPNSDDILEQANGGGDVAVADEKQEAKANDENEGKEGDGGEAKEKGEQDSKEMTPAAGASEKKPKHTNVDEATAKVLESLDYESAIIRDDG
ncbi:Ww domain, partial [Globisporangium polare]